MYTTIYSQSIIGITVSENLGFICTDRQTYIILLFYSYSTYYHSIRKSFDLSPIHKGFVDLFFVNWKFGNLKIAISLLSQLVFTYIKLINLKISEKAF